MGVNISQSAIAGTCDNKCSYLIGNYLPIDTFTCLHTQQSININCPSEVSYAIFNQNKFTVSAIQIHTPSLFTYNDTQAPAEIMIAHRGSNPYQELLVFIPIQSSSSPPSSTAKAIVENWIQATSTYAPSVNATTSQGIDTFNVSDLIPKSSFYYIDINQKVGSAIIIFNINNAIIISDDTFSTLSNLITPIALTFTQNPSQKLFYNQTGVQLSTSTISSNDIYIDCQPTGASEEEVGIEKENSPNDLKLSLKDLHKSTFIIAIASVVIFIIVLYGLNTGMKYLKSYN
jgi:hypothetical protein